MITRRFLIDFDLLTPIIILIIIIVVIIIINIIANIIIITNIIIINDIIIIIFTNINISINIITNINILFIRTEHLSNFEIPIHLLHFLSDAKFYSKRVGRSIIPGEKK